MKNAQLRGAGGYPPCRHGDEWSLYICEAIYFLKLHVRNIGVCLPATINI